ncbi:hypothetical protein HUJ04_012175 [Dendroctonus ponderosae]|nr:hypothetical protein HUJ04_012175 [Dendroctonus ponderosae]KAH1029298.1 hypothetical protein HUJ05_002557 [Dendroctonus ponderosae]
MDRIKHKKAKDIGRARSALSVSDVDYYLSLPVSCPTSPAASTLTLTPGRIRNIELDMEHLRASRQDNPFVQRVIASRESLLDSSLEEESDNASLMSKVTRFKCCKGPFVAMGFQELSLDLEADPLSLPEVHEHMIRSPPPTHWQRFAFPCGREESAQVEVSHPKDKAMDLKPKHSSWSDGSDSSLKSFKAHYYHDRFSLLTPNSLRTSAEDSIRLMGDD